MNEIAILQEMLDKWRARRDEIFEYFDIDEEAVYEEGLFHQLPYEAAMTCHYVDAYASAVALLEVELAEDLV